MNFGKTIGDVKKTQRHKKDTKAAAATGKRRQSANA